VQAALTNQRAVDVFNLNTALDQTLRGLKGQTILLMLRNRKIQGTLDGLGLGFGLQYPLGTLDLGRLQLKVLMGSFRRCTHRVFAVSVSVTSMYIGSVHMYIIFQRKRHLSLSHCRKCVQPCLNETRKALLAKRHTLDWCRSDAAELRAFETVGRAVERNAVVDRCRPAANPPGVHRGGDGFSQASGTASP